MGVCFFKKIIRNACLWALRIDVLCYFVFRQTAIICFISQAVCIISFLLTTLWPFDNHWQQTFATNT